MPKGIRKCKVCGCEYPYCKTNRTSGVFRYQDVACSPEHGKIYLSQVLKSRSKDELPNLTPNTDSVEVENDTDQIDYFSDDFDENPVDSEEYLEIET